jgi:hypothetical protein
MAPPCYPQFVSDSGAMCPAAAATTAWRAPALLTLAGQVMAKMLDSVISDATVAIAIIALAWLVMLLPTVACLSCSMGFALRTWPWAAGLQSPALPGPHSTASLRGAGHQPAVAPLLPARRDGLDRADSEPIRG